MNIEATWVTRVITMIPACMYMLKLTIIFLNSVNFYFSIF